MTVLLAGSVPASANADAGTTPAAQKSRRLFRRLRLLVLGVLLAAVVIALAGFYLSGVRWFNVATPSMGQTAPVGTLVVTAPVTVDQLHIGSVITFRPPTEPDKTFTHRIVGIDSGSIRTKGDINGAQDPWLIHQSDLVGQEIAILPGVGWAVRAFPLLALGVVALWFLTSRVPPTMRAALRVNGLSFVVSAVVFILKPLVAISVLATFVDHGIAQATVVSTGMLPIRALIPGGSYADLTPGVVKTISASQSDRLGHFQISTLLHLQPAQWALMIGFCVLPLLWCLIVGLPGDAAAEEKHRA